jgi:hypothetical protein
LGIGRRSVILLLVVGGCTAPPAAMSAAPSAVGAGGHAAGAANVDSAPPLTIWVVTSAYGKLIVRTLPDATCRARATLPSGSVVLAGDFVVDQPADAAGQVIWAYRTPVAGAGSGAGHYAISCSSGGRSVDAAADFDLP